MEKDNTDYPTLSVRKVSRRNQLLDLYKACKKEAPELYDRLANKESDNALRSDKLFLYYSQMEDVCIPEMPLIWMSYSQTDMILIIYIHNRRL